MKRSRFTEHQILAVLKEADAGAAVKDLCRRHGISPATYYQWKSKYAGLLASDLKKMRELERENTRLKQLFAETSLENQALKELIHRKL
jgi:putative transposase